MPTALFSHPVCTAHDTGPMHPESPDRLKAIMAALEKESFALLQREDAPHAHRGQLLRVHPEHYIDEILAAVPDSDMYHHVDPDTVVSRLSGEAALRAAGGVCAAVDGVLSNRFRNAFCAVRPPGHHAERERSMGFCLFNNVAVGALHARAVHGLERIAVVDWDVHHGNGTQHIFWDDPGLFYASTHQYPYYPGTGRPDETGVAGNIVNAPLEAGAGSEAFRAAMTETIVPALRAFAPQLVMISAGFDAHARDPLAQLRLTTEDFAWATRELSAVADEHCQGRVVSVLEGGYDLPALTSSVAAHLRALMGS